MSVWDAGRADQPEEEREGDWVDPLDGEVPGRPPRGPEDEEWKSEGWPEYLAGPEYRLWRKQRDEEEG